MQPNPDVVHVQYREPYSYHGERDDDEGILDLPGEAVSGPIVVGGGIFGDYDDGQAWQPARGASVLSIRAAVHM